MIVADFPPWMLRAFALALGLLIGSFLNVVIARVPRGESVVTPGSHCICGRPIAPWDNIPVLSWLILRGRARCCGAPISARYPTVELIGGVLTLAIAEVEVVHALPWLPIGPLVLSALVDAGLSLALIAAAFIDLEHMYLPDPITIGGTVVALASAGLRADIGWRWAPLWAATGFLGVYLPFIVGWKKLRGQVGMGMGDAKLMALFGAWIGPRGMFFALFAASVQGIVATLVVVARHGEVREPESVARERQAAIDEGAPLDTENDPLALPPEPGLAKARIPFGPFLILGALEYLLVGRGWMLRYFAMLGAG